MLRKWADQLLPQSPVRALHLYASLGDWSRVIEVLADNKEAFRAALLLKALKLATLWRTIVRLLPTLISSSETKPLDPKARAALRAGLEADVAALANSVQSSAALQLRKELDAELDAM